MKKIQLKDRLSVMRKAYDSEIKVVEAAVIKKVRIGFQYTKEILIDVVKAVEEMESFFKEKPNETHYVANIPDANANPKVNFNT